MSTWSDRIKASCPGSTVRKNAEIGDSNGRKVSGLLSVVPGCFRTIACFLPYGDVQQLRCVSRYVAQVITMDDVIWEEQLNFFHNEMRNMYGSHLLRTDFASSPQNGFDRFVSEHRLYDFDSLRTWGLHEHTSIRDDSVGMFTLPLYKEFEEESSDIGMFERQQLVGSAPLPEKLVDYGVKVVVLHPQRGLKQTLSPPSNADDEEALLNYVLALSQKEYQELEEKRAPFDGIQTVVSLPVYTPGELITMIDELNSEASSGRFGISDVTSKENSAFLNSLSMTLSGAKRRRLHLPNHHRGVRNNGQTTRHRLGHGNRNEDSSSSGLPSENAILSSFNGMLLEVSSKEINHLVTQFLPRKWLRAIETFVSGISQTQNAPFIRRMFPREWVRYFLLPEVCHNNRIGILIVDPLRALLLVDQEREPSESDNEPDRIVAQHGVIYGRGNNANIA